MANKRSRSIWQYFLPCLPTFIYSSGTYNRVSKGRVASSNKIKYVIYRSFAWDDSFNAGHDSWVALVVSQPSRSQIVFSIDNDYSSGFFEMKAPNVGSETCPSLKFDVFYGDMSKFVLTRNLAFVQGGLGFHTIQIWCWTKTYI